MTVIGAFLIEHGVRRPQIEVIPSLDRLLSLLQRGEAEAVVVDSKARHLGPIAGVCEYCEASDVFCYLVDGQVRQSPSAYVTVVESPESAAKKILKEVYSPQVSSD